MTVWDRPEPPARPAPLDRERIVAAAISLADEGGRVFSVHKMRKVLISLGMDPD